MSEEALSQERAEKGPSRGLGGRRTWLRVLLCAVILVCGMAIGSGATLLWMRHKGLHVFGHPERAPAAITARLRSKLDLTDEQARKVEEILQKRQRYFHELRREMRPRLMEELEKLRTEVAEVLTPEQAKKWEAHLRAMQRKWLPPPSAGSPSEGRSGD